MKNNIAKCLPKHFLSQKYSADIISDFLVVCDSVIAITYYPILIVSSETDDNKREFVKVQLKGVTELAAMATTGKLFDYVKVIDSNQLLLIQNDCVDDKKSIEIGIDLLKKIRDLDIPNEVRSDTEFYLRLFSDNENLEGAYDCLESPFMLIYLKKNGTIDEILFDDLYTNLKPAPFSTWMNGMQKEKIYIDLSKMKYFKMKQN